MEPKKVDRVGLPDSAPDPATDADIAILVAALEAEYSDPAALYKHSINMIALYAEKKVHLSREQFEAHKFIAQRHQIDQKMESYDPLVYIEEALEENPGRYEKLVELAKGFKVQEIAHWKRLLEGKEEKVSIRPSLVKANKSVPSEVDETAYDKG